MSVWERQTVELTNKQQETRQRKHTVQHVQYGNFPLYVETQNSGIQYTLNMRNMAEITYYVGPSALGWKDLSVGFLLMFCLAPGIHYIGCTC